MNGTKASGEVENVAFYSVGTAFDSVGVASDSISTAFDSVGTAFDSVKPRAYRITIEKDVRPGGCRA